jgi:translation initiation factor 4A
MALLSEGTNSEPKHNDIIDFFEAMKLKTKLLRGIYAYGLERPSAFQQRTIMSIIKGAYRLLRSRKIMQD